MSLHEIKTYFTLPLVIGTPFLIIFETVSWVFTAGNQAPWRVYPYTIPHFCSILLLLGIFIHGLTQCKTYEFDETEKKQKQIPFRILLIAVVGYVLYFQFSRLILSFARSRASDGASFAILIVIIYLSIIYYQVYCIAKSLKNKR